MLWDYPLQMRARQCCRNESWALRFRVLVAISAFIFSSSRPRGINFHIGAAVHNKTITPPPRIRFSSSHYPPHPRQRNLFPARYCVPYRPPTHLVVSLALTTRPGEMTTQLPSNHRLRRMCQQVWTSGMISHCLFENIPTSMLSVQCVDVEIVTLYKH
jgi:hypothetical protein